MTQNEYYVPASPKNAAPRGFAFTVLSLIFLVSLGGTLAYLELSEKATSQTATVVATKEYTKPFPEVAIEGESGFIYDVNKNTVLFEKNADVQLPLASLTKVALALVVGTTLPLDAHLHLASGTYPTETTAALKPGETWRVGDLISYTLMSSSNDGAQILADAANDDIRAHFPSAPEDDAALWRMNTLAKELGLRQTYFLNVNGLDRSASQAGAYGSARDIAKLLAYAAQYPQIFSGTGADTLKITSTRGYVATAVNTDKALGDIPGVIMGKTGYTDLAGGNLAVVFEIGPGRPIVAVVLHSTKEGRFRDMLKLVDASVSYIAGE